VYDSRLGSSSDETEETIVRKPLLFSALMVLAAPALAERAHDRDDADIAAALPPPEAVEQTGEAMQRMLDAMMDIRVGPLLDAVDPARPRHRGSRDDTLGEMASRDDPYFEERMDRTVDAVTVGMGEMMARMAALAPVLRDTMEDVEQRIDDAMGDLPPGYDD
jgi:hypothetical protein